MKLSAKVNELRDAFDGYRRAVEWPEKKLMWFYERKSVEDNTVWPLANLASRTSAAQELGYEVKLVMAPRGLEVWYVKKPTWPAIP